MQHRPLDFRYVEQTRTDAINFHRTIDFDFDFESYWVVLYEGMTRRSDVTPTCCSAEFLRV